MISNAIQGYYIPDNPFYQRLVDIGRESLVLEALKVSSSDYEMSESLTASIVSPKFLAVLATKLKLKDFNASGKN